MLQQFYKDTLQSKYIKYLLNNTYIPTVPFTANIYHITKGNTYIHDGYFVTAKVSDSMPIIETSLSNAKIESNTKYLQIYNNYFIKHEPYVFGRQYLGLTTNYKSNIQGYDPETHYYLGEYLRAYKAYYNIDLMPYYNCFSNEYIDYINLYTEFTNDNKYNIKLKEIYNNTTIDNNNKYTIISVPIKFCQKYTIAMQCSSEVLMLPAFIGKKGLLKEKTEKLNNLNSWGKSFNRIDFNKPIIYESPHINSVSDNEQSALQTYDKYLKLLIQVPSNLKSTIVVLEGEFSNIKNYSQRIINTSKEDVSNLWVIEDSKNLSYENNSIVNIPENSTSTLILNPINAQKIYVEYDNMPILFDNNDNLNNIIKFQINGSPNLEDILNKTQYSSIKDSLFKYSYELIKDTNNKKFNIINLNSLTLNEDSFGSNKNGDYYKITPIKNTNFNKNNFINDNLINENSYLSFENNKTWDDFIDNLEDPNNIIITKTLDNNDKSIKALVMSKGDSNEALIDIDDEIKEFYNFSDGKGLIIDVNNPGRVIGIEEEYRKYVNISIPAKYNEHDIIEIGENVEWHDGKTLGCDFSNAVNIKLPPTIKKINSFAFNNHSKLTSIYIPIIDGGLEEIGQYAFHNCNITGLTLPESVTSIGSNAFYNCNKLKSLLIPTSVTYIGSNIINIGIYNKDNIKIYVMNSTKTLDDIKSHIKFNDVNDNDINNIINIRDKNNKIYSSIEYKDTEISYYKNNNYITAITIPKGIKSIPSRTFQNCSSLTEVIIKKDSLTINDATFDNCYSLKAIDISKLTNIPYQAFKNCSSLQYVNIKDTIKGIGYQAFFGCQSLTSIAIPEGIETIKAYAFYGCSNLQQVLLPRSIMDINYQAFNYCNSYNNTTIKIKNKLTKKEFTNKEKDFSLNAVNLGYWDTAIIFEKNSNDSRQGRLTELSVDSLEYSYYRVNFYIYELSFLLSKKLLENELISLPSELKYEFDEKDETSLNINLDEKKIIGTVRLNPLYKNANNQDIYSLKYKVKPGKSKFTNYLNNYMHSNLSLLFMNNQISYAFTDRLIEYLLENVITSNDLISKNIKRAQAAVNFNPNGIWDDALRVSVFNSVINNANRLDRNIPMDMNGFVDKDSEKLLNIQNKVLQDNIWK